MDYKHTLTEIVNGTTAKLSHICNGWVYYHIKVDDTYYELQIDTLDEKENKDIYFTPTFKSITLMRWIRKGMITGKFIQI
jgi:hypothetical protein